jgi:hypothetical protein
VCACVCVRACVCVCGQIPSAWGYNGGATLFLGDINTGTWSSRLGESQIWDSSNCKRQTHPLVRDGAPYQQTRTVIKIWSEAPEGGLIPRQTGRLTIDRNITQTQRIQHWGIEWVSDSAFRVFRREYNRTQHTEAKHLVSTRCYNNRKTVLQLAVALCYRINRF